MKPLRSAFFTQHNCHAGSSWLPGAVLCSFTLLHTILWCGCTTVCWVIHLSEDFWADSSLGLLFKKKKKASMNIHVQVLCECKFSFLWNKYPKYDCWAYGTCIFSLKRNCQNVFHFTCIPATYECSSLSASLPALGVITFILAILTGLQMMMNTFSCLCLSSWYSQGWSVLSPFSS